MRCDGPGTRFLTVEERALQRLKLQIELPEPLEHHVQALQVLLLCAIKDYDVIQVDHAICKVQFPQGILHEMLERRGVLHSPNGMQINS